MANQTLTDAYRYISTDNKIYQERRDRWQFLLDSYVGGDDYRRGGYLTRYQLETDGEYNNRLATTPLDNHCRSVISVYISFLFRESPQRDFSTWTGNPIVEDFMRDADFEGRDLDSFMKEVATWANVFGHCWILMTKPRVQAITLADELAQGVRPYVNVLTPLVVVDWNWQRQANGRYELVYFKYVEDVNNNVQTIREWTPELIRTWIVDQDKKEATLELEEPNGLGSIPAVIVYNQRSMVRGIGASSISDTADQQRAIYNELSEVEQGIRLDGHPSLVKTPETEAGSGAGAIIHMPDNLDPGLKPYLLTTDGASVDTIYKSIANRVESIDRMNNTGSVRAVQTREISGIAMQTEFQLLNARLSEMADNLELAEEQLWNLFAEYQGLEWTGTLDYPGSFNITDRRNEFQDLKLARESSTDPIISEIVDRRLVELLGEDPDMIPEMQEEMAEESQRTYPNGEPIDARLPEAYQLATNPEVPPGQNCENCSFYDTELFACSRWEGAAVRPMYWCRAWQPGQDQDASPQS